MNVLIKRKAVLFIVICLLSVLFLLTCILRGQTTCMGVQVISEDALYSYAGYAYQDYSLNLLHNGEKAAIDVSSSTIYIAQDVQSDTNLWDLEGQLEIDLYDHELFFVRSQAFDNLSTAVSQNEPVQLLVTNTANTYMLYDVVFTTLPVLRMDGEFALQNEDQRDVFCGDCCLWTPNDPDLGRYSVKTSQVQWHVRGDSSSSRTKVSWKLSTKNRSGENRNINLLGLGEDDDWILNALSGDDTNLREILFINLWNQWSRQTQWNLKMSSGHYVELIIGGEYRGLYLLQRRIDKKYLILDEEDILIKGQQLWSPSGIEDLYKIVASPLSESNMLSVTEMLSTQSSHPIIHLENFADVNLFLHFASSRDNTVCKNMYYVFLWNGTSYTQFFIPWDTDVSFGIFYSDELHRLVYDYNLAMNNIPYRREFGNVQSVHPEIHETMATRWKMLRQSVFSLDNVHSILFSLETELNHSGVLQRDQQRWGTFFQGEDTVEMLYRFIEERLVILDVMYDCCES